MKNPLAHKDGALALAILIAAHTDWRALTPAQQRCLLDPATRSPRPWAALQAHGYADTDTLTPVGAYLADIIRRTERPH